LGRPHPVGNGVSISPDHFPSGAWHAGRAGPNWSDYFRRLPGLTTTVGASVLAVPDRFIACAYEEI